MSEHTIFKSKVSFSIIVILFTMILLGFYIRMIPVLNNERVDLQWDAAYNYRMCQELVNTGKLPLIDKLSIYPIGRDICKETSVFLYYAVAACHLFFSLIFGKTDLQNNIFVFNSLCGALIGLPIYLAVLSITRKKLFSLISAFLAIILPLGVQRTFSSYFRFEVLGIFLVFMFFAFLIRALNAENGRKAIHEIIIATIFLILAIGTWRMTLLFFLILSIIILCILLYYKNTRRIYICYWTLLLGYAISCVTVTYLRAHNYIFSIESAVLGIILAMTIVLYYFTEIKKIQLSIKAKLILTVSFFIALIAIFFIVEKTFLVSTITPLVKLALAHRMNRSDILTSEDLLMSNSPELTPVSLPSLLGISGLSWSAFLVLIYIFSTLKNFVGEMRIKTHFLIFALWSTFIAFIFFFAQRMIILASPFCAIAVGMGLEGFYKDYILRIKQRFGREASRVFCSLLVAILLLTALSSITIMLSYKRAAQMPPILKQILFLFKEKTPPESVIWAHWQYGYPIEAYSNRATLVDGLFEIPEIRRRVIEGSKILVSEDEEDLITFCRKYDVSYILLTRSLFPSPINYLGLNFSDYYKNGKFTEKAQKTLLLRIFNEPFSFKYIKPLFIKGEYSVFYVPKQ